MKKFALIFSVVFFSAVLSGQANMYWVRFKDKAHNPYSLSSPQQFLSQRSIDRRINQGIQLDETDLPLTPAYIDTLLPYVNRLALQLKWLNLAVVEIDSLPFVDSVKQFSFVDSMAAIDLNPLRSQQANDKMEAVFPVDQHIVYPNPYGASYHQNQMLSVDLLHQLGYRGQGIMMSMMDNGWLNADTFHVFDSVRSRILLTWDYVHNRQNVYGEGGHGTSTFSCVAANKPGTFIGTAPEANYFLFETEQNDAEWVMEEYNWVAAAQVADSAGAQLFSTSLGYTTFKIPYLGYDSLDPLGHTYADLTGDRTVITRGSNMAYSKGILVLSSAGNEGAHAWHFISAPADGDSVLAIGAVDSARIIGDFSGRGPNVAGRLKPDLCAQGSGVYVIAADNGRPGMSGGTSFSCPVLAGGAASLWSAFPQKSARQIKEAILLSADRYSTPDNNYGYGIPDLYKAYLFLKTNYNDTILRSDQQPVIFPNPFTDELHLSLYNPAENGMSHRVEIFDLQGRKVFSKDIFVRGKGYDLLPIDARVFSEGQYILRLDGNKKFSYPLLKLK